VTVERVTATGIEAITVGTVKQRVTAAGYDAITAGIPKLRLTATGIEVLTSNDPTGVGRRRLVVLLG
jgi:hypothetical protein